MLSRCPARQQDHPARLDPPPTLNGSKRAVNSTTSPSIPVRHPEAAAVSLAGPFQQPTRDTPSLANDCVYWLG
jgi:hypothetical protein